MCGRYVLKADRSEVMTAFEVSECPEFDARYNVAPLQFMPVIRQRPTGQRVAHLLRWGLIPSWSKDDRIATKLINARSETLAEKPSFRSAYKSRRCIVPASGFYEWQQLPEGKQPYFIHHAGGELLGFAGLWERWNPVGGEPLDTFTIVTTQAVDDLGMIHERMPVILHPDDYGIWLYRETPLDLVQQVLSVPKAIPIKASPVSKAVGSINNEGAELIRPLDTDGQP